MMRGRRGVFIRVGEWFAAKDELETTRKTARFMKDLRASVEVYFEILPVEARGEILWTALCPAMADRER